MCFFFFSHLCAFINSLHMFCTLAANRWFPYLVRFLPRYWMVPGSVVHAINFSISISVTSMLAYRNAAYFCTLILYPESLLNSCFRYSNFFRESFGLSVYRLMASVKGERSTSHDLHNPDFYLDPMLQNMCLTKELYEDPAHLCLSLLGSCVCRLEHTASAGRDESHKCTSACLHSSLKPHHIPAFTESATCL